jgi:KTSC domain
MIPVASSRVSSIGFQPPTADADTGRVWVVFAGANPVSGYYDGVDLQTFELFRDSDSKGKFLNENFKGKYQFIPASLPE